MRRQSLREQTKLYTPVPVSRRASTIRASSTSSFSPIQWPRSPEEEEEEEGARAAAEEAPEGHLTFPSRNGRQNNVFPHLRSPVALHQHFSQRLSADIPCDHSSQTIHVPGKETSTEGIVIPGCGNPAEREIEYLCEKGYIDAAFARLDDVTPLPRHDTLFILLKTCRKLKSPSHARRIQNFLLRHKIPLQESLGDHLISTLAKCGNLKDACTVLNSLPDRTSLSWSFVISGLVEHGQFQEALFMYARMLEECVMADSHILVNLLKACGDIPDQKQGQKLHAVAILSEISAPIFVGNVLIGMYRKFGKIVEVEKVFGGMPERDLVSWNSMLSAYLSQGEGKKGLLLYRQLRTEGWEPNPQTFVVTLQACALVAEKEEADPFRWQNERYKSLSIVQALHAEAKRSGCNSHPFVATTLVTTYGKCGTIHEAENVSDTLSNQDVVSWTAMFSAYGRHGQGIMALQLYKRMLKEGMNPDSKAFAIALQACEPLAHEETSKKIPAIEIVQALHKDAWNKGFSSDPILSSLLVSVYCKCGTVKDAEDMFCSLICRDITAWTAMVSAYAGVGEGDKAIKLYRQMLAEGIVPDSQAFATALQACGALAADEEGSQVRGRLIKERSYHIARGLHADSRRRDLASDSLVSSMLISAYSKCGTIQEAEDVFVAVSEQDSLVWLKMLLTYLEQGKGEMTLLFFKYMQEKCIKPNSQAILFGIQACALLALDEETIAVEGRFMKVKALELAEAFLVDVKKVGYDSDIFVATALVNLLGKCGCIEDAENVCSGFCKPDIVLCTAMLSVYTEQGQGEKALDLYTQMQRDGILTADEVIFVCVLQACGKTGNLEVTRHVHFSISFSGMTVSGFLASVFTYAYGNCASIRDLQAIFDVLVCPDLVTINACIAGHAGEGNLFACEKLAQEMQLMGCKPDEITFVSLLSACSHVGLVYKGLKYIETLARDYQLILELKHYSTLLDLLGRAGDFCKIESLLLVCQFQLDLASWLCLLGACRIHKNATLARQAFDAAVGMQPNEASPYILMSRIYTEAGMHDLAAEVENRRSHIFKDCMTWPELD